jgi:hypothetical protein
MIEAKLGQHKHERIDRPGVVVGNNQHDIRQLACCAKLAGRLSGR